MNWIKSKVAMLPAKSKVNGMLVKDISEQDKILSIKRNWSHEHEDYIDQHLYFTSDEEIKEGDWFICNQAAQQCIEVRKNNDYPYKIINKFNGEIQYESKHWKSKIIATTDKSIGLPEPSKEFLDVYIKAYNEGKKIKEVLIQCNEKGLSLQGRGGERTVTIKKLKDSWSYEEHCVDMQYYMEHCERSGYVTPQEWLSKYKHY